MIKKYLTEHIFSILYLRSTRAQPRTLRERTELLNMINVMLYNYQVHLAVFLLVVGLMTSQFASLELLG